MSFTGKTVVITGASSGIGHKVALDFAEQGAKVIAVARRKERLEALVNEAQGMKGEIIAYPGDISDRAVNEGMIDFAVEQGGKIDVLVNNAGVMDEFVPIGELSDDLWQKIMRINLDGPMYSMRKAVQVMTEQVDGGNIVNIASVGGVNGARAGAAYTTSKHAIVGLTKNTAFMYAGDKIRCNVICPGGVETEVMDSQTNISEKGIGRVMAGMDTSIRSGKPEEISAAVLFLASDAASFVNGSVFVVDGALTAN